MTHVADEPVGGFESMSQFLADCLKVASETRQDVRPPDYNTFKCSLDRAAPTVARQERTKGPIDSASEMIGGTPLIRLSAIEAKYGLKAKLFAKADCYSAGGSVKDRIGRRILELAEQETNIKRGDIVIEATSGNTGIGMALMCAIKGYQMVVVMPEKMSAEKENCLKALGAKVIRTRTSANWNDADSHCSTGYRLCDEINSRADQTGIHAFIFDQYKHEGNVLAHYQETGVEILEQVPNGKIDALIISAGTGGTLSGVASRVKQERPQCKIVAVDPAGSILHKKQWSPEDIRPYEVEGIGYDFHPPVFYPEVVDEWLIVGDDEAFPAARELIALEGILCGGSSGTAMVAAIQVAKTLPEGSNVVFIIPDSIRNYLTKFASDQWMVAHGFMDTSALELLTSDDTPIKDVSGLKNVSLASLPVFADTDMVESVIKRLPKNISHFLVKRSADNSLVGLLDRADLYKPVLAGIAARKPLAELVHLATLAVIPNYSPMKLLNAALMAVDAAGRSKNAVIIMAPDALPAEAANNMKISRAWLLEEFKGEKSQEVLAQCFVVSKESAAMAVL